MRKWQADKLGGTDSLWCNGKSVAIEKRKAAGSIIVTNNNCDRSYSTNNTYIGFYRVVHDAKYVADEIPPLPHSSTWFSHLEDPGTGSDGGRETASRTPAVPEDDDIEIDRERISLKCPLTLLPFQDPVTSTKCPHSFEKTAIEDMIRRSTFMVDADHSRATGHQRARAVQCPVCTVMLTLGDIKPDVALLRRVKRAATSKQQNDDDLDAVTGNKRRRSKGGRQSGVTIAGDDGDEEEDDDEEGRRVRARKGGNGRDAVKAERTPASAPRPDEDEDEEENGEDEQEGEDGDEGEHEEGDDEIEE